MSLQARMSESDQRLYNPNRDVAHCFGDMVREVAARLEDERWPIVKEMLEKAGVGQDQLGQACEAFCKFVSSAMDAPKEKMNEALSRCGWYNVPDSAQLAYMAYLGTVVSGYFYAGIREATLGGVGPAQSLQDLREAGSQASKAMTRSVLARKLHAVRARFSRAFRLLFKGD